MLLFYLPFTRCTTQLLDSTHSIIYLSAYYYVVSYTITLASLTCTLASLTCTLVSFTCTLADDTATPGKWWVLHKYTPSGIGWSSRRHILWMSSISSIFENRNGWILSLDKQLPHNSSYKLKTFICFPTQESNFFLKFRTR